MTPEAIPPSSGPVREGNRRPTTNYGSRSSVLLFGAPLLATAGYYLGMITVVPISAAVSVIADRLDPGGATGF